jgi:RNA-directed DNA polymerase
MRRELHVRFCEGGGVQLPSATRLIVHCRTEKEAQEMRAVIAARLQSCGLELHGSGRQGCKSRKVKDLLPSIA